MIDVSQLIDIGLILACLYLVWENYKNNEVIEEMCESRIEIAEKHNALARMCAELEKDVHDD